MLTGNQRYVVSIFVTILIVLGTYNIGYTEVTPVSERTSQVRDAIVAEVPGVDTAADVTETHLGAITSLNLRAKSISTLNSGDFSGLTGLTSLNLYGNELSSLPDGIFEGLTALTTLRLGGNTVDPMPITVSLEKVADGQFKAVVPTGALFDIVLPISATNGIIASGVTTITIAKGSTESNIATMSRTVDTTAAVTANIGTLPSLPLNHYGYVFTKSNVLPLEILSAVMTTPPPVEPPIEPPPVEPPIEPPVDPPTTNIAPVFTAGIIAIRSITENAASGTNIGTAVSATDANENDMLTYTLGGINATSFEIDSTNGQLKTKNELDYEMKRVYSITISVSDGSLTDTITVIVSVIDVDDTPFVSTILAVSDRTPEVRDAIVTALPGISSASDVTDAHLAAITSLNLRSAGITELKSGDFSGMTGLTSINLYGNMLSTLPMGIFEGLSSLNSLRLGGNLIDPLPLIVSVQQIDVSKFRAVVHTGAPFDIVLPIGAMMVTIPKGSLTSASFTALSTPNINALPALPANHFGYVLAKSTVCNRTIQVSDAIVNALPGIDDCRNVSEVHLATITSLKLSNMSLTSLLSDDFSGLLSLTSINLSNNQLESLPDSIFDGLTSLSTLDLRGNSVDPLPLLVSLKKVSINQFRVVLPSGAPSDIMLPISVVNGSIVGNVTHIMIPAGSIESQPHTVLRASDTFAAVSVDIGSTPSLPAGHIGYVLAKANELPLEIFSRLNVAPVFTEGATATRTIAENTVADTNIGNPISATDANNDTLTYSLTGIDATSFNIVSTTGQLKTKSVLDYETKTSYVVTVIVSDGELTDSIAVTINVTDVDETPNEEDTTTKYPDLPNTPPVFTEKEMTTRTVAEDTSSGVNIGSAVSATDADDDILTYSLSGTDASSFSIDSSAGQLRTSVPLDYETKTSYSVTITVSDGKEGSDSISVTINITDVDEALHNNAPVFTDGDSTTRTVAEDTGSGVNIGSAVSATDADDDILTYSLSGTDASSFSIDSSAGQLRTSAPLDYETKTSYSVTITVSDGKEGSDSISVTINITDVDEALHNNAPVFTDGDSTTRTVAEDTSSGVNIGSAVSATDADDDILTYSLSGTDASSFSIDSSAGQLRTSAPLDYETKTSYSVTITVSDGKEGSDSISVTINITDVDEALHNNAPVFTDGDSTTRTVAEDTSSGVNIGSAVSATDADDDILTYSLSGTDASSFSINSTNGQLRTSVALDYETDTSYSVTITVSDGKEGTDSISVTINITDVDEALHNNAPVFTDGDSTTRTVAEDTGSGVNIGSAVSATDADDDILTYSLSGTDASSFSINSTNGQLRTSVALDYETDTSYSVTITVSDGKGDGDSISVTINIIDVDETPTNNTPIFTDGSSITRSVAENTDTDTDIGSVITATDADNDILTYSLSGTDASSFSINNSNGQLQTNGSLNYEVKSSYSVVVTVSDGNGGSNSIFVTINVTNVNEAPAFTVGTTTRGIAENVGTNINIGSAVKATDPDADDSLTYTLSGTDADSFAIEETTGQLKTKAPLDFETKTSYTVIITATDADNLSDSITVMINIADLDETPSNNAPVFTEGSTTTRSIEENTDADVNIGTPIAANDTDSTELAYVLSGDDASSFSIDLNSGQLKTNAPLNHETQSSYTVTVEVSDGSLKDTIEVTIIITDVNEIPVFAMTINTTLSVEENTRTGTHIGTAFTASDVDDDTLTYILGGTDAGVFDIDTETGQLKTKTALDYETTTSYSITITASDGTLSDTINVTINVLDVNENRAPVFSDGESTTRSIAENTGSGVNIGSAVAATDDDNDVLTYTLGGTDASSFSIGSTNGQLRTKAALDYETKSSYSVTITASDGKKSDSIDVTITVTDVDENRAPVFASESTTRTVAENTGSGVNIGGAVSATDADDDTLTYTLSGTDAPSFDIGSTNGQLRTKATLDYETKSSYSVTITASDGKKSDSIDVTITVTDVDENRAPVFASESTTRTVAENTGSGVNIGGAVSATDADDDTLIYTLSGTDAPSFDISSTNGQLRTKAALDYETKTSYSVTITASDGKKSDSIDVMITVTDIDENRAPVFASESTTRTVAENTGSGVNIGGAVSATDADDDTLTYTLSGTDAPSFDISSTNGQLRTKAALDYETKTSYSVTITASDGKKIDSITVTITVTDVDENRAPAFASESTTRTVAENTGSGVNIGGAVSATDADDDTLTYTLSGTDAPSFDISSTNGQLRTNAALDYETKTSYSVTITASDGKKSDSITVTITVTDVDENRAPAFASESTTRTVAENTGSGVNIGGAVSATDADDDTLTYTLSGTDAPSFDIGSTNGQLRTNAALDYETKSTYSVTITASDGKKSDSIDVMITVTDVDENRAPVFASESTTRSVAENTAAGENIGNPVGATDADNDTLTYTLLGGVDEASFSIVSTSGQLQTSAALDYETKTSYSVTVSVSDGRDGSDTIIVTIDVTDVDEPTIDPPLSERTQQVRDAIVLAVSYAVPGVDDPADVTPEHLAEITTLSLAMKSITSMKIGDFDGLTALITLLLHNNSISDISPLIGLTNLKTLTLQDNSIIDISPLAGMTNLTTLTLNNNDISDISALAGMTKMDNLYLYNNDISDISALAGMIKIDWLLLSNNDIIDISPLENLTNLRELRLSGNDIINITELSGLTNLRGLNLYGNDIINISALADLTSLTALYLQNNSISDISPLADLTSLTDLSLSGNDISNISPLENLTNLRLLTLNRNSISDYGPLRRLKAAIEANDRTLDLDIPIPPENRPPTFVSTPDFTYTINMSTATVGDNIGAALTATDPDGDMLTFSVGGDDASYFSISSDNSNPTRSAQLQVTQALINDTRIIYSINVIADDGKGGTAEIAGTVTASNRISTQTANNRPVFTDGSSTTRSVAENTAAGENIGDPVVATDADSGDILTYLLGGTDAASFDIDNTTGQLKTKTALDYETKTTYTVVVTATDDSGVASTNSANITVTINVTDATETPPTTPLNERTPRVQRVIVALITTAIEGVDSADDVTAEHLASITFLDLYNPGIQTIYSLKPSDFDGLTALTRLDLGNNSLNNTSALSGLTNLTHLNLERNTLDDISALSGLTNLTSLDLSSNEISVISALSGLTNLTHLNLTLNSIIDISSLSGLTNLKTLDLRDNSIGDISSLSGLTNLTSLDLSSNEISVISALSGLTNLKDLDLSFNSISDISSLSGLTNLTSLYLLYNSLSDISSLSGLTNLKTLDLSGNSLSDISSLSGLTNLTSLDLSSNSLSDISALSGLTNLTYLNLPSNSISNISSLSGLTNLTALSLNNNSIIDISSLSGLTNLKTLYLINNSIIDTAVLEDLTSLRTLVLSGNSISDYGPLRRLIAAIKADGNSLFFDINIPPLFTEGTSTTRSIAENTPAGTNIGTAISATDANDYDTLTYSLSGTDAASFAIEETTGQLQTKAVLNFDTKSSYTVIVSVSDEGDGSDSIDVTINVTANGNAPTETSPPKMALLANFPNPFNPETWIPYQLSKSADVTLTIYNMRGVVVRQLELGQKPAGIYRSQSRAIHWDGRNSIGEKVATGVYFYTFTAGDFTATRKMLIRK